MRQAIIRPSMWAQTSQRLLKTKYPRNLAPTTNTLIPALQKRLYAWGTPDSNAQPPDAAPKQRFKIADFTPEALEQRRRAKPQANAREAPDPDTTTTAVNDEPAPAPDPLTEEQLRAARQKEHDEGVAWIKRAEREKILSTAARLRLKKEVSVERVKRFATSLLAMPDVKADAKVQRKVAEAVKRLDAEGRHVDDLLEQMADLLDMPYPELMHMTRDFAEEAAEPKP